MRLVADEGVDKPIVDHLRTIGHSVIYIAELSPSISDNEVLKIAQEEKAVLVTLDTDFGELIYRLKESTYGILLLRISGLDKKKKQQLVENVLDKHSSELIGRFTVITKDTIRIRKL